MLIRQMQSVLSAGMGRHANRAVKSKASGDVGNAFNYDTYASLHVKDL